MYRYKAKCVNVVDGKMIYHPVEAAVATEKTGSFGRWIATVTFANGQTLSNYISDEFPEIK